MIYIGEIQYDTALLACHKELVIFGSGTWGVKALQYLSAHAPSAVVKCFTDNSRQLWNTFQEGLPVLAPADAVSTYPEAEYVIASQYAGEISMQLISLEISPNCIHILRF